MRGQGGRASCKHTSLKQTCEAQGGVRQLLAQRLSEDVMELVGCNVRVAALELVVCQCMSPTCRSGEVSIQTSEGRGHPSGS